MVWESPCLHTVTKIFLLLVLLQTSKEGFSVPIEISWIHFHWNAKETLQFSHSVFHGGTFLNKDEDFCAWKTCLEYKLWTGHFVSVFVQHCITSTEDDLELRIYFITVGWIIVLIQLSDFSSHVFVCQLKWIFGKPGYCRGEVICRQQFFPISAGDSDSVAVLLWTPCFRVQSSILVASFLAPVLMQQALKELIVSTVFFFFFNIQLLIGNTLPWLENSYPPWHSTEGLSSS